MPSSQAQVARSISSIREALVASVACAAPPVSRNSRYAVHRPERERLPGVGGCALYLQASSPAPRRSWCPRNTGREPARSPPAPAASWPSSPAVRSHRSALRRSCQTIAGRQRLAGRTVPKHDGLALVCQADAGDALEAPTECRRLRAAPRGSGAQISPRVVLDPARLRVVLGQRSPMPARRWRPPCREGDRAGRGGALVEDEDQVGGSHGGKPYPLSSSPRRRGAITPDSSSGDGSPAFAGMTRRARG